MIGSLDDASTWSPLALLVLATAATYLWRGLGTAIAAKIDPESDLFQWVACVAYALLAGLISRIIVFPVGILEGTHTIDRVGATLFGFLLFFVTKRNIAVGTLSAAAALMLVVWMRAQGML